MSAVQEFLQLFTAELIKPSTIIALVAAFGAAYFGSRTAYKLTKWDQEGAAIRDELRAVDAAISMCFGIANTYIAFKRQMVAPTVLQFENEERAHARFLQLKSEGTAPRIFNWTANMESFPPVRSSAASLGELVLAKIAIRGRGFDAIQRLIAAEEQLAAACMSRDGALTIIAQEPHHLDKIGRYLGIPLTDGSLDLRLKNSIEGIKAYTDDCIFFSHIASEDLRNYGNGVRRSAHRWLRRRLPRLSSTDWSEAKDKKLIPSPEDYAGWLRGFVYRETRFDRLRRWAKRTLRLPWFGYPDD